MEIVKLSYIDISFVEKCMYTSSDLYFIKLFYSYANYSYIVVRFISLRIRLHLTDILHDFHSFMNSAKYGMFVI